jgi:hypothetical protein
MSAASHNIQAQIRNNSLEVSDFLSDLHKWQADIGKKDESLKRKKGEKKAEVSIQSS